MSPSKATSIDAGDRHRVAVANSIASAHDAAARGEYVDALSWVAVLEAIGDLPDQLVVQCRLWRDALRQPRVEEPTP